MFSFQKLAVFVVILAVLWLGFRFVRNLERQQKERERVRRGKRKWFGLGPRTAGEVEMQSCPVCRNWVATGGHCGRGDCPWPLDRRTSAS